MKTLAVILFLLLTSSVKSQTYGVQVYHTPYVALENGQSLVEEAWIEAVFSAPIGFNFTFFNQIIDTLFSQDFFAGGYLTTTLNYFSTGLIMPINIDLVDRGWQLDSSLSPILYEIEGSPGQRIFTLEFKNAGFYFGEVNNGIYTDYINIQLKLKEENGDIEVHIGPYSVQNPGLVFEGFTGPTIGLVEDFNFDDGSVNGEVILLDGDPANPEVITEFSFASLVWPIPENTIYLFSRMSTKTNDAYAIPEYQYYFPNPATNSIQLKDDSNSIISAVRIADALGNTVSVTDDIQEINLEDYLPGIYFVHFNTTSGYVTQRISVIR